MGPRYDFFVSFTGADAEWAEWIAGEAQSIENEQGRPCEVLFQKWDFVPGTSWAAMIDKGVRESRRIIPVLSPTYLDECPFGAAEWQAVWRRDPNGVTRSVVPVRVRECDPDGLLGPIVYIDLVGQPADAARVALTSGLTAAISGVRPRRTVEFPGDENPIP
jgi:hypothetical protein